MPDRWAAAANNVKNEKDEKMFVLDTGDRGAAGPFISWSARGTQDGSVPPRSFYLRDGGSKTPLDISKGIVLDIESMKTGWQHSQGVAGVAPEWRWNDSPAYMQPCPGERSKWKMGISVRCAIGGGNVATWEQAGSAVFNSIRKLSPQLSQQPALGQLPLVRMTGAVVEQYANGSTVIPTLEVVKWVDRPDCLKEGAAAGIASEPTPAPAPAAPAVQPADLDDAEF
jgi:hypothetical protein